MGQRAPPVGWMELLERKRGGGTCEETGGKAVGKQVELEGGGRENGRLDGVGGRLNQRRVRRDDEIR